MTWIRRHPLALAYLLIVSMSAAGLWAVQHEAAQRRGDLCHTVNDQQAVLSDLLDVVLTDGGGGLPLTQIPSYQQLDAATQTYLADLEALSRQDNPNSLDDRLRAFAESRLIPAECQ